YVQLCKLVRSQYSASLLTKPLGAFDVVNPHPIHLHGLFTESPNQTWGDASQIPSNGSSRFACCLCETANKLAKPDLLGPGPAASEIREPGLIDFIHLSNLTGNRFVWNWRLILLG